MRPLMVASEDCDVERKIRRVNPPWEGSEQKSISNERLLFIFVWERKRERKVGFIL